MSKGGFNGYRRGFVQKCSFCGKTPADGVNVVVGSSGSTICDECAAKVVSMTKEGSSEAYTLHTNSKRGDALRKSVNGNSPLKLENLPTPREMVAKLDEYVIGQEEVKRTLATAVYNHYARICSKKKKNLKSYDNDELAEVEIDKSNIIMIGPTGCGKTLLAKSLAKMLNVPFAIADATTLTEAGYVGEDVENIVRYLYNNANGNKERTEMGIVVVDEVDKIASKTQNVSITRDVSGEGVQQALLKIVEGTTCRFPAQGGRKHPEQALIEIDTSNILFIVGGAFVGLDKIVEKRIKDENGSSVIGFTAPSDAEGKKMQYGKKVRPEDLVAFGLIPEFVGRLPIITEMKELTENDLVRVLTEPKNSLVKQYQKLLRQSGVEMEFEEAVLREVAKRAIERHTGARGLRAEMEELMKDVLFEAPERRKGKTYALLTQEGIKYVA